MNIAQRITIDPAAKSYVSQPRKTLIDGEWINAASGKTFPVYDPSTGEVLANVAEADAANQIEHMLTYVIGFVVNLKLDCGLEVHRAVE